MDYKQMLGNNNYLVVSCELLYLIKWIVENDQGLLAEIISKAYEGGLRQKLETLDPSQKTDNYEELQEVVSEFFLLFLELLMQDETKDLGRIRKFHKSIISQAKNIDLGVCGEEVISLSIAQAIHKISKNKKANAREALYGRLLKNWKPKDKNSIN